MQSNSARPRRIKTGMSARNADQVLDHLSNMVRMTGQGAGRIEATQGLNLQYWANRISAVIEKTDRFSSQQERAKRLMTELLSRDRA